MIARSALIDQTGAAAVEMVLLVPLLLVLLFGGLEAGHFIWTEHKLIEGVRDGSRFAARLDIEDVCGGDSAKLAAAQAKVRLLTRTGQLADGNASPRVPRWSDGQVTVTFACDAFVSTGIYSDLDAAAGPIVTVTASGVAYPSLFERLGILDSSIAMSATSHAAVIGL